MKSAHKARKGGEDILRSQAATWTKSPENSAPALEGIRVLDFGRYMACPYAAMLLADMGADVVRVEPPGGADDRLMGPFTPTGESIPYSIISGRNKRGITLSIRKEEGLEILHQLIRVVDVILHNFAPGAPEAKILCYDYLGTINPRIIVLSLTAFGKTGPYAQRPGFDSIAQGISSMMSWAGLPGNPPTRTPLAVLDFSTGVFAAYSTALCLLNREKTGLGQEVDTSLLDTVISFVAAQGVAAEVRILDYERPQVGNHSYYNFSDSFRTKDGWVMINAIGNKIWSRLLNAFSLSELAEDTRFQSDMLRFENRALLQPIFSKLAGNYTSDELVETLEKARVPCGKINTPRQMMEDPQIRAREMLADFEYPGIGMIPLPGIIPKLSRTPGQIRKRAPKPGEDNEEVYTQYLGLSKDRLRQLKSDNVI